MTQYKLINDPIFIRGIIGIFIVAIIMSIFELILYYKFAWPKFKDSILTKLNPIGIFDSDDFSTHINTILNILKGISKNDENNDNYINSLKATIMSFVIIILFILTLFMFNRLEILTKNHIFGKDIIPIILNSVVVFIVLIIFQIIILFFSLNYNYGNEEELELRFVNSLLKARGEQEIDLPSGTDLFL